MTDALKNKRILIVDDNPDICDVLNTLLEGYGALVVITQSVDGAVQAFRQFPAHAVITDIRLGDSDGYELLEAIRRCNIEYRGITPVLALTGYASPEDEARARAAGFDAYLCKPCDPHALIDTLARALTPSLDLAA